jgi:hypothetical protein
MNRSRNVFAALCIGVLASLCGTAQPVKAGEPNAVTFCVSLFQVSLQRGGTLGTLHHVENEVIAEHAFRHLHVEQVHSDRR